MVKFTNLEKNYGSLTSILVLLAGLTLALTSFNAYILAMGVFISLVYSVINYKKQMLPVIKFSAWIIFGFVLSQAFFYWGFYSGQKTDIIFWVIKPNINPIIDFLTEDKGIAVTYQGILWGLVSSAKLIITLYLAFAFSKGLNPKAVLNFLKKAHISPIIALGTAMTFRLLPEMLEMAKTVYSVSKVRKPKNFNKLKMPYTLLKALIYSSVKKAYVTSIALETKGLSDFAFECENAGRFEIKVSDILVFGALICLVFLNFFIF